MIGNYTNEYMNYMNVPLKGLTVFRNDVMPKRSVLNRNAAWFTEVTGISCNAAAPEAPPAGREWVY